MPFEYFSERETGSMPRTANMVSPQVWGGIVATVNSLVSSGGFGEKFPEVCPDGSCVTGTDQEAFGLALQAEVPNIRWPLQTNHRDEGGLSYETRPFAPDTMAALDFVQFCYAHVSKPIQGSFHSFFKHHHLSFDRETGREEFRRTVNRIFARNGLAFELQSDGSVIRLAPPIIDALIQSPIGASGDSTLDQMLEDACRKFLSPDERLRGESLERLWDAWERLKSLDDPKSKKRSVACLLDKASNEPKLRARLEAEARELTDIGNTFMIRHSETDKVPIQESNHVGYLFHRMFSLIYLLVMARRDERT